MRKDAFEPPLHACGYEQVNPMVRGLYHRMVGGCQGILTSIVAMIYHRFTPNWLLDIGCCDCGMLVRPQNLKWWVPSGMGSEKKPTSGQICDVRTAKQRA